MLTLHFAGNLPPIEARHENVRHQNMDRARVLLENRGETFWVSHDQHAVSTRTQDVVSEFTYCGVIFHQKDGLGSALAPRGRALCWSRFRQGVDPRCTYLVL